MPRIRDVIPSIDEILRRGIQNILKRYNVKDFREAIEKVGISKVISEVEREAHRIYIREEKEAIKRVLEARNIPSEFSEKISGILGDLATQIANIRRVRGGLTVEKILIEVFRATGIPCERGKIKIRGYRPDIVIPNNEALESFPERSIAIAVKRTLRERWAEDIDVFKFKHGKFILITPDPDFNEEKAKDMIARGMKAVYIPDELYKMSDFIKNYPQFKKLSELIRDIKEIIC